MPEPKSRELNVALPVDYEGFAVLSVWREPREDIQADHVHIVSHEMSAGCAEILRRGLRLLTGYYLAESNSEHAKSCDACRMAVAHVHELCTDMITQLEGFIQTVDPALLTSVVHKTKT